MILIVLCAGFGIKESSLAGERMQYTACVTLALYIPLAFLAIVAVILVQFTRWRRAAYARVRSGSLVVQTARGPVEYAVSGAGDGPVVMVLHGGLGGFDQGLLLGSALGISDEFTMLCPSRAGYLQTPLTTCTTPEETADALAALLDELNISEAAVIGISGGGPTALQFALRHSRRTRALGMFAAISRRHEQPERTRRGIGRLLFSTAGLWLIDLLCWLLITAARRWRPSLLVKWTLQASETHDHKGIARHVNQVMNNPRQFALLDALIKQVFPLSLRKIGLDNDLAQFAGLAEYPVERITCPTLVVHGRFDGNVPLDHAMFVAQRVPGAELCVVEDGGHFYPLSEQADKINERIMTFLRIHAKDTPCNPVAGPARVEINSTRR